MGDGDLDGAFVLQAYQELMPKVRRSDGFIVDWNRDFIVKQLITETKLAKEFYNVRPMNQEEAEHIAVDVERKILSLRLKFISGPLIRELVNNILLSQSKENPEYAFLPQRPNKGWCTCLRRLPYGRRTRLQSK